MIPEEPEESSSILDSFAEKITHSSRSPKQKRQVVYGRVKRILCQDFESMKSWEEWHNYLNSQGMILTKQARGSRCDANSSSWSAGSQSHVHWSRWKRFVIFKTPSSKERTTEWVLIPEEWIEKMIVLGRLDEED